MTVAATVQNRLTVEAAPLEAVKYDLYRDIHKGIRSELFGVTQAWGSVDPTDSTGVEGVTARLHRIVELLVSHAEHEDEFVQPWIDRYVPTVGNSISVEHERLEAQLARIEMLADQAVGSKAGDYLTVHRLYLGMASFTADYLQHQGYEELVVMPSLASMVPVEKLVEIEQEIVASIPPADMAYSLGLMIPSMNMIERVQKLGAIKANAPAPAFAMVMGIAENALGPDDAAELKVRLGVE